MPFQAGKLAAAETVLGDMAAAGVRPNHVTFTTLIDGHVRAGDMAAAQRVLDAMLAAGEAPTAVTYNALLRGYASKAAQAAAAVEAGAKLGSASSASSADGGSAAAAASAGASSGAAAGVLGAGLAAAAVMDAEAAPASPLSAALQLLTDMQAQGVHPAADTFNTLMAAAVGAGEPGLALELHQRLLRAGLRPDALTFTTLVKVGLLPRGGRGDEPAARHQQGWRRGSTASAGLPLTPPGLLLTASRLPPKGISPAKLSRSFFLHSLPSFIVS